MKKAKMLGILSEEKVGVDTGHELALSVFDVKMGKNKVSYKLGITLDDENGKRRMKGPGWDKMAKKIAKDFGTKQVDKDIQQNPEMGDVAWFEIMEEEKFDSPWRYIKLNNKKIPLGQ